METNEPPHAGNLTGSSLRPPVASQRTVQESRPIHILLLCVQLIIRSHSPPPPGLCSLSFNFLHYSQRLAFENSPGLSQDHRPLVYHSVRALSDVSGEAVSCRCRRLCSLTPLQSSTHYWSSLLNAEPGSDLREDCGSARADRSDCIMLRTQGVLVRQDIQAMSSSNIRGFIYSHKKAFILLVFLAFQLQNTLIFRLQNANIQI